mmetsp:Transcript_93273/g.250256  ORF Transcript_93273/g.250256 Transcript_93273/m.250256 type:complete len:230 (+) Transcript_93273:512-1201(+)
MWPLVQVPAGMSPSAREIFYSSGRMTESWRWLGTPMWRLGSRQRTESASELGPRLPQRPPRSTLRPQAIPSSTTISACGANCQRHELACGQSRQWVGLLPRRAPILPKSPRGPSLHVPASRLEAASRTGSRWCMRGHSAHRVVLCECQKWGNVPMGPIGRLCPECLRVVVSEAPAGPSAQSYPAAAPRRVTPVDVSRVRMCSGVEFSHYPEECSLKWSKHEGSVTEVAP